MTQPKPWTPAEHWSPETDPDVIARRRETAREYGQWVADQDIYYGAVLAYRAGDPVPVTNVEHHGYDRAGLVRRVAEAADFDDPEPELAASDVDNDAPRARKAVTTAAKGK